MKTHIKTTLIALFSLLVTQVFAQEDYVKKYERNFNITETSNFKLSNKYGKVHIETNNSNKLEIKVEIIVNAKNKDKAEDIFDNIEINFEKDGNEISAITEIDGSIKNTEINYFVKMPETLKIDLSNKYGYIFIDKLKSQSKINCKYGDLHINELLTSKLENKATIDLKYSKGLIKKCDYTIINVKYSDLIIDESRVVEIISGYSNIKLKKAYIIDAISKYDPDYTINEVGKLVLKGKYSSYNINNLQNSLKAVVKYSNIEMENVKKDFEQIIVVSEYGNTEIKLEKEVSYTIKAKVKYGSISSKGKIYKKENYNFCKIRKYRCWILIQK